MRTMTQLRLISGTQHLTTWVEKDSRLAVGSRLTPRDPEDPNREWTVAGMSAPHLASDIKVGWDNNI